MNLYLGCGPSPTHPQHLEVLGSKDEWTFVDLYVREPHIKNWDARDLPVEDGSVDKIYASHLLEHFNHGEVPDILRHWHSLLVDGGGLILNVPDLIWSFRRLRDIDYGASIDEYYNTFAGEHGVLSIIYGSQSHEGEYHKGGFTEDYLKTLLNDAGFSRTRLDKMVDAHEMGVLITHSLK